MLLAALQWKLELQGPYADVELTSGILAMWGLTSLVAGAMLAALMIVAPQGARFVCEPLVPWRISIPMFGAFFSAWLSAGISIRAPGSRYQCLIPITLCWIAPFYGFFHAPWFLAQSLVIPCPGRPLAQVMIAAAAMAVMALAGARVAAWMFKDARN